MHKQVYIPHLQGRPYKEKMKFDRIEMLYWLQEERKQNAMKYEAMMKQLPLNMSQVQLDPINTMKAQTVAWSFGMW